MTEQQKTEAMELAKQVAEQHPPKSGIEKYIADRKEREAKEAEAHDQVLRYCGLKK